MNRIRAFQIILITASFVSLNAQNKIQGYIFDNLTNNPVPYSIVSEIKQRYGCYSDTNGSFTLLYLNDADSLKISSLGYQNLFVSVSDLKKVPKLSLTASPVQLNEILINPNSRKLKDIEIGSFTRRTNIAMATVYPMNLHAFFIPAPEANGLFMIRSIRFVYEISPGSVNSPLRIRLLDVNSKGEPGADLVSENIVFKKPGKAKKQVADIDISKAGIFMPPEGVFVAFEWIMDKSLKQTNTKDGIPGPYLGEVKSDKAYSKWSNILNGNKWIKVQSKSIPSIGMNLVDYSR